MPCSGRITRGGPSFYRENTGGKIPCGDRDGRRQDRGRKDQGSDIGLKGGGGGLVWIEKERVRRRRQGKQSKGMRSMRVYEKVGS